MLPGRDDIALPPFAPGVTWIGGEPPVGERLTARGPLLVHFFEVGELSGVRTLPFVDGLAHHYGDRGLTVLGVHSPRSGLAADDGALAEALERLGVAFPVANDREHRIWHGYGCEGWPSTFLWGRGGKLRWVHFGEGAYHETEAAIRTEIGGEPADLPPTLLDPPRDEPAPALEPPSPEVFPGGAYDRPWQPRAPGEPLEVSYAGAGAWAALDGTGTVEVAVDGEPAEPFELAGPGLYELSSHDRHGAHAVRIDLDGPVRVWSVSFAPGVRGGREGP
jgi:hypothetical protein